MRILVATGGAAHSDEAVRAGELVRQLTGGRVSLLTVIRHASEHSQAQAILLRARSLIPHSGVETYIRQGKTAEQIVMEAKAYDLLVVGERPRHTPRRYVTPPTVEKIVARMPCPVLIVRGYPMRLERLLVCESGREPSLMSRLIEKLAPILRQIDEITVLHVMSQIAAAPGVADWALQAEAQELIDKHSPEGNLLESDMHRLKNLNVRQAAKVRHGLVVDEILDEARDGSYDLVVIGAHRGSAWERFLLDDIARELIASTECPLLVI